jgi:endonuclease-3 related protein
MPEKLTVPRQSDLLEIYNRFVRKNGRRNWWPVSFNNNDSGEVDTGGFEIVAGAILVQNTTWKNAERALGNMHASGIWGYRAVHETQDTAFVETIRSSGYYNTKTKKLKAFAEVIVNEYSGSDSGLFDLELADLRQRLLDIYGIGEETADDIILYAAKKPSFVMDAYTRRLVDRLGWHVGGNRYSDYQELFSNLLEPNVELWGELHAQLDGHAARVCRKLNPLCHDCVLLDLCPTGKRNTGQQINGP